MASIYVWAASINGWGHAAYSCSPESHALVYAIVAMALTVSTGGVIVWKRCIRTQPVVA